MHVRVGGCWSTARRGWCSAVSSVPRCAPSPRHLVRPPWQVKDDPVYCWKAYRLLARHNLAYFGDSISTGAQQADETHALHSNPAPRQPRQPLALKLHPHLSLAQ